MADHLKTPLAKTFPLAVGDGIDNALNLLGKSLPASVVEVVSSGIVKVKFEVASPFTLPQVIVPVAMSEYVRLPIQPGCKGAVVAFDARLGGASGLGTGTADLSKPGNLTALLFVPIGNTGWPEVAGGVLVLYGPDGVTVRDQDSNCSLTVTKTRITMSAANGSVSIDSGGVAITGTLTINGKPFLAHEHLGVTTGAGTSGGVAP